MPTLIGMHSYISVIKFKKNQNYLIKIKNLLMQLTKES